MVVDGLEGRVGYYGSTYALIILFLYVVWKMMKSKMLFIEGK